MGDKGGKKDKDKQKQQQLKKHQEDDQKKHDKAPPHASIAGAGVRSGASSDGGRK